MHRVCVTALVVVIKDSFFVGISRGVSAVETLHGGLLLWKKLTVARGCDPVSNAFFAVLFADSDKKFGEVR